MLFLWSLPKHKTTTANSSRMCYNGFMNIKKLRISLVCTCQHCFIFMSDLHTVFCFHGLNGHTLDLRTLESNLLKKDQNLQVVRIPSYIDFSKLGVVHCADLAANFIINTYSQSGQLSFIGHSFGGVVARHTLYLLDKCGYLNNKKLSIFATFASPLVGCRELKYVTDIVAPLWGGKTGMELTVHPIKSDSYLSIIDDDAAFQFGCLPNLPKDAAHIILLALTSSRHIEILSRFKRRIIIGNASLDVQVRPKTSLSLPIADRLPSEVEDAIQIAKKNEGRYTFVRLVDHTPSPSMLVEATLKASKSRRPDNFANLAALRLNVLQWERRVVSFNSLNCHTWIVGHPGVREGEMRGGPVVEAFAQEFIDGASFFLGNTVLFGVSHVDENDWALIGQGDEEIGYYEMEEVPCLV